MVSPTTAKKNVLKNFEDLNRYITILIVDDEEKVRTRLKRTLDGEGYECVWAYETIEEAEKFLPKTNILLADHLLPGSWGNGVDFVEKVKKEYGDKIEAIVFSGKGKNEEIKAAAFAAGATAYFEKPLRMEYIKLWINELGKKIWLKGTLDSAPDEVLIFEPEGTILWANQEKKRIFGEKIIGEKCYQKFEKRGTGNRMCAKCLGRRAYKEKRTIRTEWPYKTRANIKKHKVHREDQTADLVAAPLMDKQDKQLAIIEICRDITLQKLTDEALEKMEQEKDWIKRIKIFLDVFAKLGYPRARLYLRDRREGRDDYHLVEKRGAYDKELPTTYPFEEDRPTQLVVQEGKALIFIVDKKDTERDYEKDKIISYLYRVGSNKVTANDSLQKKEWMDIHLFAGGEIIGKVSVDGWKPIEGRPDSYDLEVLGHFGTSAGQIIQNARQTSIIERRSEIEKVILNISRDITNGEKGEVLLSESVKRACDTMKTMMCSIFIWDNNRDELVRKQSYGIDKNRNTMLDKDFFTERYKKGESLTRKIFKERKAKFINRREMEKII